MLTAGLVVLATAGIARANQRADEKFCASAAAFDSNVAELHAINRHSTVAELRDATNRVENSANDMQRAARKMKTPAAKQFEGAMTRLRNDVNTIPDDATLDQVRTKISSDIQNAQSRAQEVAIEAGCPSPPPSQR
jgi:hypothetical protein